MGSLDVEKKLIALFGTVVPSRAIAFRDLIGEEIGECCAGDLSNDTFYIIPNLRSKTFWCKSTLKLRLRHIRNQISTEF